MAKKNKGKVNLESLQSAVDGLDDNRRLLGTAMLRKVIFMDAELEKLQERIAVNGCTETYQNGANQFGIKKSSEVEVYNTMIRNYNITVKALFDMMPTSDGKDELESFLGAGAS